MGSLTLHSSVLIAVLTILLVLLILQLCYTSTREQMTVFDYHDSGINYNKYSYYPSNQFLGKLNNPDAMLTDVDYPKTTKKCQPLEEWPELEEMNYTGYYM